MSWAREQVTISRGRLVAAVISLAVVLALFGLSSIALAGIFLEWDWAADIGIAVITVLFLGLSMQLAHRIHFLVRRHQRLRRIRGRAATRDGGGRRTGRMG